MQSWSITTHKIDICDWSKKCRKIQTTGDGGGHSKSFKQINKENMVKPISTTLLIFLWIKNYSKMFVSPVKCVYKEF